MSLPLKDDDHRDYPLRTTSDPIHLAHLRRCLALSLECVVSPTAFCVGSTVVLPIPSPTSFPSSPPSASAAACESGHILSTGYSREPPRPTSHAESSAITKLLSTPLPLVLSSLPQDLYHAYSAHEGRAWPPASHEELLRLCDVYTTLEPCSVRTSGEPDCAGLLAGLRVRRVFVGVDEPPDFVDCKGTRVLETAGVEVWRVVGLETECLAHARRGRE